MTYPDIENLLDPVPPDTYRLDVGPEFAAKVRGNPELVDLGHIRRWAAGMLERALDGELVSVTAEQWTLLAAALQKGENHALVLHQRDHILRDVRRGLIGSPERSDVLFADLPRIAEQVTDALAHAYTAEENL